MNETQKNIKRYQAALPGIREKIAATAMLLMVSLSMVVSATFAWYTISAAPEVSAINTTVAANGNLEIALAYGAMKDGQKVPEEVKLGDSSAAADKPVISSNITWGNLVNLSDGFYGMSNIILRPALISGYGLDSAPLYGVTYSEDGRVKDISGSYRYASWKVLEDTKGYFDASDEALYGVRAISSVKYENITGNSAMTKLATSLKNAYNDAVVAYNGIISMGDDATIIDQASKTTCMDALMALLQIYVQERADNVANGDTVVIADYKSAIPGFYKLLLEYQKVLDYEGEALRIAANMQIFAQNEGLGTNYFQTVNELLSQDKATLASLGVTLESLESNKGKYREDCANLKSAIEGNGTIKGIKAYNDDIASGSTEKITWANIVPSVKLLVDIENTMLDGKAISKFSSDDAGNLLDGNKVHQVVITSGVLKNTEQRLGDLLARAQTLVQLKVKKIITINVKAYVTTSAGTDGTPFYGEMDKERALNQELSGAGDAVSLDTYGMAVDLWVRTNVQDTVLTLEGHTVYEEVEAFCRDSTGAEVPLYVATSDDGASVEVYYVSMDGDQAVYVYDSVSHHMIGVQSEMMTEEGGGYTFSRKLKKVITGYQGENRVWMDWEQMIEDQLLAENNTTQGAGSCYVFYANPSDQNRILEMLQAFTITFIDQNGNKKAVAKLDTESAYDINGKVTVPLKIISGTAYVDEENEEQIGIMGIPRNEATWLTAIVYLDGMQMSNKNVLDASIIEGRLNLQFGSSVPITGAKNDELAQKERSVSADVFTAEPDATISDGVIKFEYDGKDKAVTVKLSVRGDKPKNVSGFFIRSVGATQGTRAGDEIFKVNDDGDWVATFYLSRPGNYVMHSVIMDGTEYTLDTKPAVTIEGMGIGAVRCDPDSGTLMTADNFVDIQVSVGMSASDLLPKQVRAIFRSDDGKEYSAVMSYDAVGEEWTGTARIGASGKYTLRYLVMDGDYTDLLEEKGTVKSYDITLGMTAQVTLGGILSQSGTSFMNPEFMFEDNAYDLSMRVRIFDDGGKEITNLENVCLYYAVEGGRTDEDGMIALNMQWDEEYGFCGNMEMRQAGNYHFKRVMATIAGTSNEIKSAPGAPVFRAMPPDSPEVNMRHKLTDAYQFKPSINEDPAIMSVAMYYAQTAEVWAVVKNTNYPDKEFVVRSVRSSDPKKNQRTQIPEGIYADDDLRNDDDYYRFDFTVPQNVVGMMYDGGNYFDGTQDGEWYIEEIWMQGVFDEDPNDAGKSILYGITVDDVEKDIPDREDCAVRKIGKNLTLTDVMQKIVVIVTDKNEVSKKPLTGAFMQEHTVSGVTVDIFNWRGQAVDAMHDVELSDVVLYVTHDGDTFEKGGYTTTASYPETPWELSGSNKTYTSGDLLLALAGTYDVKWSYKVDGTEFRSPVPVMTIVVESPTPTAEITEISPTGNFEAATVTVTGEGCNAQTNYNTYNVDAEMRTDYAKVYFKHSVNYGIIHNFEVPTVTITLGNAGNATKATLSFTGDTTGQLYANMQNSATTDGGDTFTWENGATTAKRWVGYGYTPSASSDDKAPAGKLTATHLVLEYKTDTFTVDIPDIVIENPD